MSDSLPDPKEMKQFAVDAMQLLLDTEQGNNEAFEPLLRAYVVDPARHEFLTRQLVAIARKFGEERARNRGISTAEMFDAYLQSFKEGPGWPLSEYMS